jgi:hypothetical protein
MERMCVRGVFLRGATRWIAVWIQMRLMSLFRRCYKESPKYTLLLVGLWNALANNTALSLKNKDITPAHSAHNRRLNWQHVPSWSQCHLCEWTLIDLYLSMFKEHAFGTKNAGLGCIELFATIQPVSVVYYTPVQSMQLCPCFHRRLLWVY